MGHISLTLLSLFSFSLLLFPFHIQRLPNALANFNCIFRKCPSFAFVLHVSSRVSHVCVDVELCSQEVGCEFRLFFSLNRSTHRFIVMFFNKYLCCFVSKCDFQVTCYFPIFAYPICANVMKGNFMYFCQFSYRFIQNILFSLGMLPP